jgi:predicted polyphosphate/ATP-dependent NAD kinase
VKSRPELLVGIVTNPEAGRDIRRLFGASVFPTSEKVSMVIRVLAALGVFGVEGVLMMPDQGGIAAGVMRAVRAHNTTSFEAWPEVIIIEQAVERSADDTRRAVRAMLNEGVRLIVVLGGDGTHRVVASECGDLPLVTLSTVLTMHFLIFAKQRQRASPPVCALLENWIPYGCAAATSV